MLHQSFLCLRMRYIFNLQRGNNLNLVGLAPFSYPSV